MEKSREKILAVAAMLGWYHDSVVADHHISEYRDGWRDLQLVCDAIGLPCVCTFFARHGVHVIMFGDYYARRVLGCGSFDSAIEDAASTLAQGYFFTPDLESAAIEFASEYGREPTSEEVYDYATRECMYTESGLLLSHEVHARQAYDLAHLLDLCGYRS